MRRINISRWLVGGLLAGLVINIGEFILNVPVAGERFASAMASLGLAPAGGGAIAMFVVAGFVLGLLAVWLYTAIRPRLGPGPRTAIIAGLFVWLLAVAYPSLMYLALGLFPGGLIALGAVWGLVEIPLATVAGSWLYREAEVPIAAATAAEAPKVNA